MELKTTKIRDQYLKITCGLQLTYSLILNNGPGELKSEFVPFGE